MEYLKTIKVIILFFSGFVLSAQTNCGKENENGDAEMEVLAMRLCLSIDNNFGHDNAGEKIEDVFLAHLKITRNTPDYKSQILDLWNTYSNCFVCKTKSAIKPELRYPTHFLKRVVDFDMQAEVFDDFLLNDSEEFPIDVNAIEMVDGKGETLLDYLNKILSYPSEYKRDAGYEFEYFVAPNGIFYKGTVIKELREYLIEDYGAKKASEL
ncbi:hypothetical protein [Tamlana flava]|uniref:hypothetical protein n=1 Tax=Tamlana flava TaxID=3158572 RepID=UPI00351BDEDE